MSSDAAVAQCLRRSSPRSIVAVRCRSASPFLGLGKYEEHGEFMESLYLSLMRRYCNKKHLILFFILILFSNSPNNLNRLTVSVCHAA